MLDVAVIGGGPAGSRTAFQLAKRGYSVAVIEKRAGIGEKYCCTGIISLECVEAFSIPPEVIYRECNSARLYSPLGDCIQVYRPDTQACIIKRSEFDRLLSQRASSAGARYYLSTEVKNIVFNPDCVLVEAENEGRVMSFEARVLVAACGFNVALIKNLGLGEFRDFVNGVQIEINSDKVPEVEVYFNQKIAPGFFAWKVPTDDGHCLVGLLARRSPGSLLSRWLNDTGMGNNTGLENPPMRIGTLPLRPLKRIFGERLLVVGDAAGQVKPTTGGGIYFGLLCADMAASILDVAFKKGDFSARAMSGYQRAWREKLGSELRTEYLARRLYERLNDRQIEVLFKQLKQSGLVESVLQQDDFSFDWHGGLLLKAVKFSARSGAKRILNIPSRIFRG